MASDTHNATARVIVQVRLSEVPWLRSLYHIELPKCPPRRITIIEHSGTVVPDLDNRKGHRKDASRLELGGKLIPEAAAALDEQLKTFEGLSGGEF